MPKYGPYDKNDDHTYALGVFPSLELLKSGPRACAACWSTPRLPQRRGRKAHRGLPRAAHPVEEAPRAVERISGKENAGA